jgi:GTPase SAR1 family protein
MAEIVSYKIGSFGHKGVGKSTYLTSLFIILSQSRYEGVNIEIGKEEKLLSKYLTDIINKYDEGKGFQLPPNANFPEETKFTLDRKNKEYEINLFDYRGEDAEHQNLNEKAAEGIDSVFEHFKKCDAIMYFYTDDVDLGGKPTEGYRMKRLQDLKLLLTQLKAESPSKKKIEKPFILVITKGDSIKTEDKYKDILRILDPYIENCKVTTISSKAAFEKAYSDPSFTLTETSSSAQFYPANRDIAYPLFYLIDELDKKRPVEIIDRPSPKNWWQSIFGIFIFLLIGSCLISLIVNRFSPKVLFNAYSIGNKVWLLNDYKKIALDDTIMLINGIQEVGVMDSQNQNGYKWYYVKYKNENGWMSEVYLMTKYEHDSSQLCYVNSSRALFYYLDGEVFVKKKALI